MKRYTRKENPTPFTAISHCSAALSKDKSEMRAYTKYLNVKETEIIATDGKRLHIATETPLDIPVGYYEIIKKTKSEIIINQVTEDDACTWYPDYTPMLDISNHTISGFGDSSSPYSLMCEITLASQGCFNYHYLDEAIANMSGAISYDVKDENTYIMLECNNLIAVLMPMKR